MKKYLLFLLISIYFFVSLLHGQSRTYLKVEYDYFISLCEKLPNCRISDENPFRYLSSGSKNEYKEAIFEIKQRINGAILELNSNLENDSSFLCREYLIMNKKLNQELSQLRLILESERSSVLMKNEELIENLLTEMRRGIETDDYIISLIPDNELVLGRKGLYFQVEFKNPDAERTLYFPIGKYTINQFDRTYQRAINGFYSEIIELLNEKNENCEFFIRGQADRVRSNNSVGNQNERYRYNEIEVLRKDNSQTQYLFDEYIQNIPTAYKNKHLPNLRSSFIKSVLSSSPYSFDRTNIHILDGVVTNMVNSDDRNVRIVLYVKR